MKFSESIINWYYKNKRDLPWRKTQNPYYIWLSEVILQQTQVQQGLPYYNAFVTKYPNIFDLANANERDLLKLWEGLGYYSRVRNLHTAAKYVVSHLNGIFPDTYKDLLLLKGVGDYTASAIGSFCYNLPTAVVDGNVYRLLSRCFGINTPINTTNGAKEFKELATQLLGDATPSTYNQAIMEFGALQCTPKNPNCNSCPLNNNCIAYNKNAIAMFPVKLKSVKITKKHFNYIIFISKGKDTILTKRTGKGIWQNLYQFPLIETLKSATVKDLSPELNSYAYTKDLSFEIHLLNPKDIIHKLTHQHLHTKFWVVKVEKLTRKGIKISELQHYPMPRLIHKGISELIQFLKVEES